MGAGREFEAKTLHEALRAASLATGRSPQELDYEVLAEGRRGVFGLGQRRVRIWVELPEDAAPPSEAEPARAGTPGAADVAWVDETLRAILNRMDFELSVHSEPMAGGVRSELAGPDRRRLLEREAEVLVALQYLIARMAHHDRPGAGRVQIDCKGYRDQRELELVERARAVAGEVARTGAARILEAMNPYERRLIHVTVQKLPGIASRSVGEGFLKRVEISLARHRGEA